MPAEDQGEILHRWETVGRPSGRVEHRLRQLPDGAVWWEHRGAFPARSEWSLVLDDYDCSGPIVDEFARFISDHP